MKTDDVEVFLEAADVARRAGVSPATVKKEARSGRLPIAARTRRGVHLFRQGDVDRWVSKRAKAQQAMARVLAKTRW